MDGKENGVSGNCDINSNSSGGNSDDNNGGGGDSKGGRHIQQSLNAAAEERLQG